MRHGSCDAQRQSYDIPVRLFKGSYCNKRASYFSSSAARSFVVCGSSSWSLSERFRDVYRRSAAAVSAGRVSARLSGSVWSRWDYTPARYDVQTQLPSVVGVPAGAAGQVPTLLVRKLQPTHCREGSIILPVSSALPQVKYLKGGVFKS